jgi:hypothetical protein
LTLDLIITITHIPHKSFTPESAKKATSTSQSPAQQQTVSTPPKQIAAPTPTAPPTSQRRKSVVFGPKLTPELIDKYAAPSDPVKRGRTPQVDRARLGTPIIKNTSQRKLLLLYPPISSLLAISLNPIGTPLLMQFDEVKRVDSPMKQAATVATPKADLSTLVELEEEHEVAQPLLMDTLISQTVAAPVLTPQRAQIKATIAANLAKAKLATPLRNQIEAGTHLNKVYKSSLSTPVRAEVIQQRQLRATKRSLPTPLKKEIATHPKLNQVYKKSLNTPLRASIAMRPTLRVTKPRLNAALQEEIKAGRTLRTTLRTMSTPLRTQIQAGTQLKSTKPMTLKTPIRQSIQARPALKKVMPKMATPLRREIEQGLALNHVAPATQVATTTLETKPRSVVARKPRITLGQKLKRAQQYLKSAPTKKPSSGRVAKLVYVKTSTRTSARLRVAKKTKEAMVAHSIQEMLKAAPAATPIAPPQRRLVRAKFLSIYI